MSTFGTHFRVTTCVTHNILLQPLQLTPSLHSYGESHCLSVGCIVDGVPPGMELTEADIQPQMTRRRPGQSAITTPRNEKDKVEIQSGTEFGVTLGSPIGMRVMNENQRPKDYGNSTMDLYPRPSHADWTYLEKYGVKSSSGGGRSSARETIGVFHLFSTPSSLLTQARPRRCRRHRREVPHPRSRHRDCRLHLFRRPRGALPCHCRLPLVFHQPRVPQAHR
jgi:chorismate synthase